MDAKEFDHLDSLFGRNSYIDWDNLYYQTLVMEDNTDFRTDEMIMWCVNNIKGHWAFYRSLFGFESCQFGFRDEIDAMAFKICFGDIQYDKND
jgi:hypothetical protein